MDDDNLYPQKEDTTENAMFTKKPLGGLSCASCEKKLTSVN
jgi:hypothetical protein